MVKPVVLDNISLWLSEKWNLKVLGNFLNLYEAKIAVIARHPTRYPLIQHSTGLRKAVLTKHNIILYREKEELIEIVGIFDTRQDPKKIRNL